jgi:hypothetical protein
MFSGLQDGQEKKNFQGNILVVCISLRRLREAAKHLGKFGEPLADAN